ncbi:hypothetical protein CBR_g29833 [Chara braunii]|uniref:LanC-like protein GCL2 n=1 Tax=Chara braunii TaxID=69332 RepID=A0A388JWR8_CHABU|nr:hypothetical protein CBR_g29833 [Chara braunii]|eukprot:GBG62225.1 hypothetical protein CBR_g29833 [Chara braunii]
MENRQPRYFANTLPDYVESAREEGEGEKGEGEGERGEPEGGKAPAKRDPSMTDMPRGGGGGEGIRFPSSQDFMQSGATLKDDIVHRTWTAVDRTVRDPFMYTGTLGTALLCLKSYQVTGNENDLKTCLDIVDASAAASLRAKLVVTFLCGHSGIYAVGAVAAHYSKDQRRFNRYINLFNEVASERALAAGPEDGGMGMPYELLYGRAGFLWSALYINRHCGDGTIPLSTTGAVIEAIISGGRAGAANTGWPLMYQWHGTRYWGAAHGLAGIMQVLMHFPLSPSAEEDVKATLRLMIRNRFPSGNYPSSEGKSRDLLVHWCHGAPGVAVTMVTAASKYGPQGEGAEFLQAAVEAADVVWERGLLRRAGLCHGVSGNAYVFLSLFRATGEKRHLHRAQAFATFLRDRGQELIRTGKMHGGDRPYSLYEGVAGFSYLWLDLCQPENSRFPGYELF